MADVGNDTDREAMDIYKPVGDALRDTFTNRVGIRKYVNSSYNYTKSETTTPEEVRALPDISSDVVALIHFLTTTDLQVFADSLDTRPEPSRDPVRVDNMAEGVTEIYGNVGKHQSYVLTQMVRIVLHSRAIEVGVSWVDEQKISRFVRRYVFSAYLGDVEKMRRRIGEPARRPSRGP